MRCQRREGLFTGGLQSRADGITSKQVGTRCANNQTREPLPTSASGSVDSMAAHEDGAVDKVRNCQPLGKLHSIPLYRYLGRVLAAACERARNVSVYKC